MSVEHIEIFIKGDRKYKINSSGRKTLICKYDNCEKLNNRGGYCISHKDGIINERKKQNYTLDDNTRSILKDKCKNNNKTGDDTEKYIINTLKKYKELEHYERIGYTGDKFDIKFKFKDELFYRSMQVKTLSSSNNIIGRFSIGRCNKYPPNTLLVLVNKDRDRFGLIYSQDCPKTGLTLCFTDSNTNSKYKNNMFTDIEKFENNLIICMRKSIPYKQMIPINYKIEKESLIRLEHKCIEEKNIFILPEDSGCIYDCIINNYHIQCKFTATRHNDGFKCKIDKNGPQKNGKRKNIPYSENDNIDFLIIENSELLGQFYIIPKQELILNGVFSSKEHTGVTQVFVPTPNTKTESIYSWILQYLNRWDLILSR
jgi:hypothetical protein